MTSSVLVALRVNASPAVAFESFVGEISKWWHPNTLFRFSGKLGGTLSFEPGLGGRLIETADDGDIFEIGRVTAWEPGRRLCFTWRQASFGPQDVTEVEVKFEPSGSETLVSVTHSGWDRIAQDHESRHGFPDRVFLLRHAEWWRALLGSLARHTPSNFRNETP